MRLPFLLFSLSLSCASTGWAQPLANAQTGSRTDSKPSATTAAAPPDSGKVTDLDEVVVTATRTPTKIEQLPVPVSIVTKEQLQRMGSMRLQDALLEQTGLNIVPATIGNGVGVQVQGLDAAYTLILVDGEPLVGREAGTLDLNRITVGNIERIEIVRGPASSLYGSDALGGVINIITSKATEPVSVDARTRYGSNNTLDANLQVGANRSGLSAVVFGNRYSTDGYNLTQATVPTVPQLTNYTGGFRTSYLLGTRTTIAFNGRYFQQALTDEFLTADQRLVADRQTIEEFNLTPSITHYFSDGLKLRVHYYHNRYTQRGTANFTDNGAAYDRTLFDHRFQRPEAQLDITFDPQNVLILGGGAIFETLDRSLFNGLKRMSQVYGFAQHEWRPTSAVTALLGARYDNNSVFGDAFSPKLALQYTFSPRIRVQASVGAGFKAPDFRQLYFNFTNPAGGGYSVFGSEEVLAQIQRLQAEGVILELNRNLDQSRVGRLDPERSVGYNLGAVFTPVSGLRLSLNLYRNDIRDLINTVRVGNDSLNPSRTIFSYQNVDRVVTQGLEFQGDYRLGKSWTFSLGYQLLDAYEPALWQRVLDGLSYRDINTGRVALVQRPEGGVFRRLRSDYGGLPFRSRHSGNAKITYTHPGTQLAVAARVILRSRYGVSDLDGNGIIDQDAEYASGYVLANLSVSYPLTPFLTLQAGGDNLLNFTDAANAPAFPGRLYWGALSFRWARQTD